MQSKAMKEEEEEEFLIKGPVLKSERVTHAMRSLCMQDSPGIPRHKVSFLLIPLSLARPFMMMMSFICSFRNKLVSPVPLN
jgi:hypothetical protein